ncbi:MAG: hypothetical protein AMXMBFR52_25610 [Burkholderiales bacterium]
MRKGRTRRLSARGCPTTSGAIACIFGHARSTPTFPAGVWRCSPGGPDRLIETVREAGYRFLPRRKPAISSSPFS